ncbi:NADAR family protein, partial [Bacillus sp. (in: firmicutes)]
HLKNKLLQTGESILIEGNTWGDKIWGVCNGVGENKLGKILMKVRNELKEASDGTE